MSIGKSPPGHLRLTYQLHDLPPARAKIGIIVGSHRPLRGNYCAKTLLIFSLREQVN